MGVPRSLILCNYLRSNAIHIAGWASSSMTVRSSPANDLGTRDDFDWCLRLRSLGWFRVRDLGFEGLVLGLEDLGLGGYVLRV